jgi:hypothetical protein
MKDEIDVPGGSGHVYRFRRLEDPKNAPSGAGNFLYVRWERAEPVILYVGDAASLADVLLRWVEAQADHQATDVFVRLNVGREARHRERDDLLQRLRPVMSAAIQPQGSAPRD